MKISKLLIANRGEIAVRIARAAAELGIRTVSVYSSDDSRSMHVTAADDSWRLQGAGPAAYLDQCLMITAAKETGCHAIHPGYGFLSENASFARLCLAEGLIFIGPSPEMLDLFGNKAMTRALAARLRVPLLKEPGRSHPGGG
jgi:acetyl/propionyl-CoA carboxylase alpha subunit